MGAGEVGSHGVGRRLPEEVPVPWMMVGTGGWSCHSVKLLLEKGGIVEAAEPRCLETIWLHILYIVQGLEYNT
jgi:hypothetical protein